MRPATWLAAAACLAVWFEGCAVVAPLRVATFRCDVTPWPGEALVWTAKLVKVEEPLLAKGIVLEDGTNRYVLCALDWCLLANDSELSFRQALAGAAGTDPARVAIQCLHQHAAPYADEGAHRLLDAAPTPLPHLSPKFLDAVRGLLAGAAQETVTHLEPFDRVGTGEAKVERVASARRLRDDNGKILTRYSSGAKDPKMAAAPEGPIDPWLKTITLARGNKPLVRLHYYATHPQTFCCDGRASADFVGLAREAVEREDKVFQIYFTGCAGDVTAGKYSDGSPKAEAELAQRLKAGMLASIAQTKFKPAQSAVWRTHALTLPLRGAKDQVTAQSRAWPENPAQTDSLRVYEGAMRLSFVERLSRPLRSVRSNSGTFTSCICRASRWSSSSSLLSRPSPMPSRLSPVMATAAPLIFARTRPSPRGVTSLSATNVGPGSEAREGGHPGLAGRSLSGSALMAHVSCIWYD